MSSPIRCIECAIRDASLVCPECDDLFCDPCFRSLHRSGSRAKHVPNPLSHEVESTAASVDSSLFIKETSLSLEMTADSNSMRHMLEQLRKENEALLKTQMMNFQSNLIGKFKS